MGIYRQPPPVFIGGKQPYEGIKRTPPTGPAVPPPVFPSKAQLAALFAATSRPPMAWTLVLGSGVVPMPDALPADNPPFEGGARIPDAVFVRWLPPPPLPPQAQKFTFVAPAPDNPPFEGGARIPDAVFIRWLPPPPQPQWGHGYPFGIPLPPPDDPIFRGGSRVPRAVMISWLPAPPQPPQVVNLEPPISGPPPTQIEAGSGPRIMWV